MIKRLPFGNVCNTYDLMESKRVIFVKDEDVLYSVDPKKNSEADFIPEISAKNL
jgi:molybdenum storage protein